MQPSTLGEDFGKSVVASQTFAFSDSMISTTFGRNIAGQDIHAVRDAIPAGMVRNIEECLKKCGFERRKV